MNLLFAGPFEILVVDPEQVVAERQKEISHIVEQNLTVIVRVETHFGKNKWNEAALQARLASTKYGEIVPFRIDF